VEQTFHPDFDEECRVCGSSPCVVVDNHPQGNTELCGACFFGDKSMVDWQEWNEELEDTE
jgi:hypothetical protein